MGLKPTWTVQPYTGADKLITIVGPDELLIYVDYDDVDHDAVDRRLPGIVATLNRAESSHPDYPA